MRPELVLNEDDKKRRFKKLKVSVTEDSDSEEGELHIAQDNSVDVIRTNAKTQSKNKISKTLIPGSLWPQDDSDDASDEWAPFPSEVIEDDESSDDQNDYFLDPETGIVVNNHDGPPTHTEQITSDVNVEPITTKSLKKIETYRNVTNYCHVQHISEPRLNIPNDYFRTQIGEKIDDDPNKEYQINKYIHKKFEYMEKTGHSSNTQYYNAEHSIEKITIYNNSEPEKDQQYQPGGQGYCFSQPMR